MWNIYIYQYRVGKPYFHPQRCPERFKICAASLINPFFVDVARTGAAVLQVVQEAKMVYLLECLQKTAPRE
jgi:hypothetical protein